MATTFLVWIGSVGSPAWATFPDQNGRIVFLRDLQIFTIAADGSDVQQLGSNVTQLTSSLGECPSEHIADCGDPDWGPAPA